MEEVNWYLGEYSGKWEIGTPLTTWKQHGKRTYRYRPLGQERGYGHGLMGMMDDEGNQHADAMRPVELTYEQAIANLRKRFLTALNSGQIMAEQGLEGGGGKSNYFASFGDWIGMAKTPETAVKNLRAESLEHLRRLTEEPEYRRWHVEEGTGPSFTPFPRLTATMEWAKQRRWWNVPIAIAAGLGFLILVMGLRFIL